MIKQNLQAFLNMKEASCSLEMEGLNELVTSSVHIYTFKNLQETNNKIDLQRESITLQHIASMMLNGNDLV